MDLRKLTLMLIAPIFTAALSAQPTVSSVSPDQNEIDVASTSDVTANFSTNMAAPTSSTFRVYSNLRGWLGGNYSGGNSSSLSFDPTAGLLPGEEISVVLTDGLQSTGGTGITDGHQWGFHATANAGPGNWDERSQGTSQYNAEGAAFGDLDNDGDIDMIAVGGGNVGYDRKLLNDGKGNFTSLEIARNADGSYACAVADMDGDGDLDVIVANSPVNTGGNTISGENRIYWNDGNANFYTSSLFGSTTSETLALDVGDLDNDGDIDVFTANGAINGQESRIWLNDGSGNLTGRSISWISSSMVPVTDTTWAVELADINGDGYLDICVGNCGIASSDEQYVYLNDGSANFDRQNSIQYDNTCVVQAIATGDFDGDGDLDMIGGGNGTCACYVYFNDGAGSFTKQQWASNEVVWALHAADMDADGDLDVIVGEEDNYRSYIMLNNGSGSFSATSSSNLFLGKSFIAAVNVYTHALCTADVDGDGDLDIGTPDNIFYNGSNLPVVSVTANGSGLISNDTLQVSQNDSVSGLSLNIDVADSDNDPVTVTTTISNTTSQGFVTSEWSTTSGTVPFMLAPTSGSFSVDNISHVVTITATDGVETTEFILNIDVGSVPNSAPVISVARYAGSVTSGSTINVPYASKMSDLGMEVTVTDADGDNVSLTTQMTNISGMSILTSTEWSASSQTAPYTLYPWSGNFNQMGVIIYVTMTADDGVDGITSFSFYFATSTTGNYAPVFNVTRNGNTVHPFDTIQVSYNDTLSSLNLAINVTDQNNDSVTMASNISNVGSTGILDTEFEQNGSTPMTLYPSSGTFNNPGVTHAVSLYVDDGPGATISMTFYIEVSQVPNNNDPLIVVNTFAGSVGNGSSLNVSYGDPLSGYSLSIQVIDPDNDTVTLTGNVTQTSGTGILNSEFSNTATAPFTINPSTGTFNKGSTTHAVTLNANDGNGGTYAFTFNFVVGAQPLPAVEVYESNTAGTQINHGDAATGGRDFGSHQAGTGATTALTIVIHNSGNGALGVNGVSLTGADAGEFVLDTTGTASSVSAGNSTTFTVAFNPSSAGTKTASVEIDHSDGSVSNPFSFDVTGVGTVPLPTLEVYESSTGGTQISAGSGASGGRDFGSQDVGSGATSALTIVVHNSGPGSLSISNVALTGADAGEFVLSTTGMSGSVSSGGSTSFTVAFDPTSAGSKNATVQFNHNDTGVTNPFTFNVTGVGTTPAPAPIITVQAGGVTVANGSGASGSLNFGGMDVGAGSAPLTITVQNAGNATLTLGSPTLTGAGAGEFVLDTTAYTTGVAGGSSTSFTIRFNPQNAGAAAATVSFSHNDSTTSTPFTFNVAGTGTTPNTGTGGGGGDSSGGGGCVVGDGSTSAMLIALVLLGGIAAVLTRRRRC